MDMPAFANAHAIIEAAPLAMIMTDNSGRIVLVNQDAERLFGYNRLELLNQPVEMLLPQRSRAAHPGLRKAFFESPESRRMGAGRDLYGLHKNGREIPVEIGLNPIETRDGLYVLSAIVDITERKRMEERFRATIESAPIGMVMIDKQGCMMLVNAETERLFGYSRNELLGLPIETLVPERFRNNHAGFREGYFNRPEARTMGAGRELFGLHKDKSEFPVEIGLNPVITSEGVFVLAGIVDITERKRMERHLKEHSLALEQQARELKHANEALERSNIELQQFAYIASHDLQSPLRSISGFVQMLEEDLGENISDDARESIRRTTESVEHMQLLIRDLLSYSRVDSQAVPFRPVDMNEIVDDAVMQLNASIKETGAIVTYDNLPVINGDRPQLAQLMQNLIGNAIKYHSVKPPVIHVSAEKTGDYWQFSVRDNGIGIDPRHHDKIFVLFKRLHSQNEYPGTGIGLAVCRRVVHRHGGEIRVESQTGQGSTFYFTIPMHWMESR